MKKKFISILKKYGCELISVDYSHPQPDWHNYDIWYLTINNKKVFFDSYYDIWHKITDSVHEMEFNGQKFSSTSKEGLLLHFEMHVSLNCA